MFENTGGRKPGCNIAHYLFRSGQNWADKEGIPPLSEAQLNKESGAKQSHYKYTRTSLVTANLFSNIDLIMLLCETSCL